MTISILHRIDSRPRALTLLASIALLGSTLLIGCKQENQGTQSSTPQSSGKAAQGKKLKIGVGFETLQTEAWVASFEKIKQECEKRGYDFRPAIADGDASKQFEQVRNFISQQVDGIILVPKDAQTVIPMIKAANKANIPMVLFNRPPDKTDAKYSVVAADNFTITRQTVDYLIGESRKTGKKHKAMILIGDLGDINAVGRRDGFNASVSNATDVIEVVSQIPTEWNQEKALAGVVNGFQANPDISFIFTSSDFMFPSIQSALKNLGKWKKVGEPGHVILGGFDGDATAYQLLVEGYLDADGVQDFDFEAIAALEAIEKMASGQQVDQVIPDKGFVIHQGNMKEMAPRMWGANVKKK